MVVIIAWLYHPLFTRLLLRKVKFITWFADAINAVPVTLRRGKENLTWESLFKFAQSQEIKALDLDLDDLLTSTITAPAANVSKPMLCSLTVISTFITLCPSVSNFTWAAVQCDARRIVAHQMVNMFTRHRYQKL